MPHDRRHAVRLLGTTAVTVLMCSAIPVQAAIEGLEIMAPSSPGSGYDQLARAMQTALQDEKLASGIQVVNVAGDGGTVGGFDHVLVGLIAKAAGVDPAKANYVVHAGGGEVLASVLGGHVTVAVSGYNEFAEQVRAGALRALAVSGAERMPGFDVPTLREQGVDVALVNWRGHMAPANARSADLEELSEAVATMVKSPAWQEALQKRGWLDLYQPADEFEAFLKQQQDQVKAALEQVGLVQ